MQDKARKYFVEMIRDCGENIVGMQSSFEMFLNQYLQDFPDERKLMLDAFKVGIPQKILQHAGEKNYADYLEKLGPRFAEAARREEAESAWGVETWAQALNRTADYVPKAKIDRFYAEDHIDVGEERQKETIAFTAMTIIVTAGGFLGGAFAAMVLPLIIYTTAYNIHVDEGQLRTTSEMSHLMVFLILGLVGGGMCGLAAFCGWWLGKGAEYPWASFCVAFGAAFTGVLIAAFVPFGLVVKSVAIFCAVFGATYKSAARRGMY